MHDTSNETNTHPVLSDANEVVSFLLQKRGITDTESFLNPSYTEHSHDPFLLPDIERALDRLASAIENNERIVIYADYDSDGIPGAVIFHDLLVKVGHENFSVYIPDRHSEGYGLHEEAIDTFHTEGADLIITVDLGSSNAESIAHARSLGIDVIVTDHHALKESLPDASAVVNPKRTDSKYPFSELCGAGVAYKVVCAFLMRYREKYGIHEGWEKWLLDMAALATVSDRVPLYGENRVIAYYGLKVLRKIRRVGLRVLLDMLRMKPQYLTEDDIGFMIVPRINAASRLDHPELAFNLLVAEDERKAREYATELGKINDKRKTLVASIVKEAKRMLSKRTIRDIIVIGNPKWRIGVLGLVASKITEEYTRPVFVWGREGSETIKGSCRSNGEVNVVSLMHAVEDGHLLEYGGHEQAGGFSVHHESVFHLEEHLHEAYTAVSDDDVKTQTDETTADCAMPLSAVTRPLYETLSRLAPFGEGNPKPVFAFERVRIAAVDHFGKQKNHLSLQLEDGNGTAIRAIAFFCDQDSFDVSLAPGDWVTVYGSIELSRFYGRVELRLRIVDIGK